MSLKEKALKDGPWCIIGPSGGGKTTLGKEIHSRGYAVVDLDDLIATEHGDSVANLIASKGLSWFRQQEHSFLEKLALTPRQFVVVGAGAIHKDNVEQIDGLFHLIWLDTPREVCWQRIDGDSSRPLSQLGEDAHRKRFEERTRVWKKAPVRIDGTLDSESCLGELFAKLGL